MSEVMRRGKYTLEFKQEGVRQVLAGQSAAAVARSLGIPKASLSNWVRQDARGELGAGRGHGSVQPSDCRLEPEGSHAHNLGQGCAGDGMQAQTPGCGFDLSQRPRFAVLQC